MTHILIYSNNPEQTAQWRHTLIDNYSVGRVLNLRSEYQADLVICDAKKFDEDASLLSVFANKNTRFLVLGVDWPEQKQIEVLMRGAAGYCEESEAPQLLKLAVDSILRGDIWIRRSLVPKVIGALIGKRQSGLAHQSSPSNLDECVKMLESLSVREVEVANMISLGENNKRIAQAMQISERTVKAHLSSIFRKLNVEDRLRLAIRLKEIDQYRKGN